MKREYLFCVNGFETRVMYDDRTVEELFLPLLRHWTAMRRERGERIIVFLSAPPGVGKTTAAQFLEYLSRREEELEPIQAVGLDGFHYHADYIASHTVCADGREVPMKQVKGAPETYDIEKLMGALHSLRERNMSFPVYDRNLHDVVEDAIPVSAGIVLIEGNWLLSTEGGWRTLIELCDDSIFIEAGGPLLRRRLIERKMRGGLTREDAERFYENSDRKNIDCLMANHHAPRVRWVMEEDGSFAEAEKAEQRSYR